MLITLDGPIGAGKSTQFHNLASRLGLDKMHIYERNGVFSAVAGLISTPMRIPVHSRTFSLFIACPRDSVLQIIFGIGSLRIIRTIPDDFHMLSIFSGQA